MGRGRERGRKWRGHGERGVKVPDVSQVGPSLAGSTSEASLHDLSLAQPLNPYFSLALCGARILRMKFQQRMKEWFTEFSTFFNIGKINDFS